MMTCCECDGLGWVGWSGSDGDGEEGVKTWWMMFGECYMGCCDGGSGWGPLDVGLLIYWG